MNVKSKRAFATLKKKKKLKIIANKNSIRKYARTKYHALCPLQSPLYVQSTL